MLTYRKLINSADFSKYLVAVRMMCYSHYCREPPSAQPTIKTHVIARVTVEAKTGGTEKTPFYRATPPNSPHFCRCGESGAR